MTISTKASSLKNRLNQGTLNSLNDKLVALGIGDVIRSLPTYLRLQKPAASSYNLGTVQVIALPDDAKANSIFRAYARSTSASGALGEMTVEPWSTTPADGQIAVTPNGDIAVLASSAYTSLDVVYLPEKQDIFEMTLSASAADTFTLPAAWTTPGVVNLLEAESLVGTLTGKLIVLADSDSKPATGKALLKVNKGTVLTAVADAVTSLRVKIGVTSAIDVNTLLEATSSLI